MFACRCRRKLEPLRSKETEAGLLRRYMTAGGALLSGPACFVERGKMAFWVAEVRWSV